jgi:tetratricopeptide (TPR) repeat protein
MPPAKQAASAGDATIWVYRPALDMIVGCGAWSLPLLALAYFSSAATTLTWSIIFYFLALFLNYPHYMATIYRAYHTEEDFQKYRIFTVHITLLVVLTVILAHFWIRILPLVFTLYLTASPWHYSGQNYGIFMMFVRRAGIQPRPSERRCLYAAFLISYAILFLNFHTGPSADPLFVSLNVPPGISTWAQILLAIAFIGCSGFGLYRQLSQTRFRHLVPSLTIFSTQCVWFLLPTLLSLNERFRVPQSRYSTGVLAVMHSAQYLWITSYYAKREAIGTRGRAWRPLAYFSLLIVGGIALFIPGPWLSSHIFHFDFTRSFLIFTALVNIHHFILDGAIWKLRDGRIAAVLLNSRAQLSHGATHAVSRTAGALRWLAGSNSSARSLRWAVALALLLLGGLDQAHYYFALQDGNLGALKHAALLAPYDTPLETRLANAALANGDPQQSVSAWEYAIKANPSDPAPREAFLRYLTNQGRFEQAYRVSNDWLRLAPRDVSLLVNHGILAQQFGHIDEAEENWQRALHLDPSQSLVDLYLAAAMDGQGQLDAAIQHYEAFLVKVAKQPVSNLPPAASLIGVVLKLADCEKRANHSDQALQFYRMALTLAGQTHELKFESFAMISEASLEAGLGQTDRALYDFQDALQVDDKLSDPASEAADWYMFAMFLRDARFPSDLVYASLIKSQSLLSPDASRRNSTGTEKLEKELEKELGSQSAMIRRNPDPLVREAMELRRKTGQR